MVYMILKQRHLEMEWQKTMCLYPPEQIIDLMIQDDPEQVRIKEELDDFFFKIFPNEELRRYMWDHAAAALIGINTHQSFNVYTGGGGNGKSMFVDLMNMVLGSYSDKCNISLITQKEKELVDQLQK